MSSISDKLLAAGAAANIEWIHGERIEILSGPDDGQFFQGVIEIESDVILATDLGEDPRSRRMLRFRQGYAPRLNSQDRVRTDDGKVWVAIKQDFSQYLSVDYELRESVAGLDTNP